MPTTVIANVVLFMLLLVVIGVTGLVLVAKGTNKICRQQRFRGISYVTIGCLLTTIPVIVILSFTKARNARAENTVINDLRRIDSAKEQAALQESPKSDYVPFVSYLQADTNAETQWEVLESLLRTNNVRLGINIGSIFAYQDVHRDDKERATAIVKDAIRNGIIDNKVLKLTFDARREWAAEYR